ncbi:hypothetical protein [Isoptericola sp. NPDC055881]
MTDTPTPHEKIAADFFASLAAAFHDADPTDRITKHLDPDVTIVLPAGDALYGRAEALAHARALIPGDRPPRIWTLHSTRITANVSTALAGISAPAEPARVRHLGLFTLVTSGTTTTCAALALRPISQRWASTFGPHQK